MDQGNFDDIKKSIHICTKESRGDDKRRIGESQIETTNENNRYPLRKRLSSGLTQRSRIDFSFHFADTNFATVLTSSAWNHAP